MSKKKNDLKEFTFEFDITGKATTTVKAKNFKEACKMVGDGDGDSELNEWDFDFPYHFKFNEDTLKGYLCGGSAEDEST